MHWVFQRCSFWERLLPCNLSVELRCIELMDSFEFVEEFVFAAVYFSALIWFSMYLVSGYIYLAG